MGEGGEGGERERRGKGKGRGGVQTKEEGRGRPRVVPHNGRRAMQEEARGAPYVRFVNGGEKKIAPQVTSRDSLYGTSAA